MIAAITPGTAYGTKNARRKNRLPRNRGESSSSANSRARPSMTGTCTTPNSSTRPTDSQNGPFWKTSYVLGESAEHLRRLAPKVPSRSTTSSDC